MSRRIQIAPSILSAEFGQLAIEAKKAEEGGADLLHIDVMDGHFVPNITIGPVVVGAIHRSTKLPLDVHLMISNPSKYAKSFIENGASILTFHYEAVKENALDVIRMVKDCGVHCGISIKPATPFSDIHGLMAYIDLLLIMTVEPGFGGQKFMADMIPKIEQAYQYAESNNLHYEIEVDGGIDENTAKKVVAAGANILVAGSSIYGNNDVLDAIKRIRESALNASFRT
ncbi:MAG: ribulose-phosphate 3-epimerase [Chlamydiota bacterium]|nr:ribulose-phosphate 3-epimerase [Chlamydiota bacterium]